MITFFSQNNALVFVVQSSHKLMPEDIKKLEWLFDGATCLKNDTIEGLFIGPRKEMISPWSTNAVEITQNMGMQSIQRIEQFYVKTDKSSFDPMLQNEYQGMGKTVFQNDKTADRIQYIDDIKKYNVEQGLALNEAEIDYLDALSKRLGRKLTDSEVFGFSQVNSEHCRHKIFNGTFIIDGKEMPFSLFQLIRKTSSENKNRIVSAYSDNVAFVSGPKIEQFAPDTANAADYFSTSEIESIISLKAETHNFPTTVEPFNGAATGSGGEIRDRMAGGKGSMPLAGTAVYMTAYPRTEENRSWESHTAPRKWLYQNPEEILIKASNGASDFGNKFGQPMICGSLLTFEHFTKDKKLGFDKVIMLAGGVGYAKAQDSHKDDPKEGDLIIVMGGDNYRIGMGGGSVSSVATGEYDNAVELNAVQRSKPEMQKRVANVIRALSEMTENPIVSVHDHGAGGHLNALSELIETTGGMIDISKLPVGDNTLSYKEIVGNESQERMGLLMRKKDIQLLKEISIRERAPYYVVGEATKDGKLVFTDSKTGDAPINMDMMDMFGNPPQTILEDISIIESFGQIKYDLAKIETYIKEVLQLEAVASKDWLTNKVDRSVTGKVATQQTAGEIQLPVNNLGVMALDYNGIKGVATSIGHAPVAGLIDPAAGSVLSVSESLLNLVWAPIQDGLKGVSLSANWMWPARNPGENARLYKAVEAISDFAIALGINIPTGKDSLSMKQQYKDDTVFSPGTVIVSTVGEVIDISKTVRPVLADQADSQLIYIDFSGSDFVLGGSSFAQNMGELGMATPSVLDPENFKTAFDTIQTLIGNDQILAGHDISSGGLITTLLEMCFPNSKGGMQVNLSEFDSEDLVEILFSEKPGIIIQLKTIDGSLDLLKQNKIAYKIMGQPIKGRKLNIKFKNQTLDLDINEYRDIWMKSSYLLDRKQSGEKLALARLENYSKQKLHFSFPEQFTGVYEDDLNLIKKPRAAIIREKGVNGDREMAYSLYAAGFEVKDIHMTDLIKGNENLEDVQMIVFVGGFSNSDVLGSAKGWAGAFLYNEKANKSLKAFYAREDTLSLGVCNGCQLMVELNLLGIKKKHKVKMLHNDSAKFESAFINVDVQAGNTVLFEGMEKSRLGIWVAHGEGKFQFPREDAEKYNIPLKYSYENYPGNPNGSMFNAAAVSSKDGRHLAMMPHLERSIFPWQWPYYDQDRKQDQVSLWFYAFVNARNWVAKF